MLKAYDKHLKIHVYNMSSPLSLDKHCIFVVFIITLILHFSSCSYAQRNKTDRFALLAFKRGILKDQQGVLTSWNRSLHHCNWEGIKCGHHHKRVVVLDLQSRGLSGTISPYIGNLSFARYIILHNNTLGGPIPSEIGFLFRLQGLSLYHNSLVGEVPPTLSKCLNLEYLDLSENNLVGRIPPQLSLLSLLKGLYVHENSLHGPFFNTIQNLTSLEFISASSNAFEGTIPDTIARMKNLVSLELGSNQFTGMVPTSVYNMSSLNELSLFYNQFHGSLPTNIGSTLPHLTVLNLGGNHFTGPLPVSLSNTTRLTRFELMKNKFTGKLSLNFGHLKHLQTLLISYNYLGSGDADDLNFLTSLINCSKLDTLSVSSNYFGGVLPTTIVNLSTTITSIGLDHNIISGEIPCSLSRLSNLMLLNLGFNRLAGSIPSDVGKLQNLGALDFSMNRLTGSIPESLGNLSKLSSLQLYENMLEGTIPSSLGNCQNLNFLAMTQNELNGTIPKELFEGLALVELGVARNHLEGPLPLEISKLKSLVGLDVSDNKLSGEIQSGLASCSSLLYLYMQGNLFHGPIPASFGSLKSLQEIDLSCNNLSGPIPQYFSGFPLTYLNLSYNHFEGEVPTEGSFANASAISLEGNTKLCGGILLHLPQCKGKEVTKTKLSLKLKLIISFGCVLSGIAIVVTLYCLYHKKKQKTSSEEPFFGEHVFKMSYNMLLKATDGFSSSKLLGSGTFGCVFRAVLEPIQMTVAVKVLNLQHQGASKSFMAECTALRNVRHRNLVRIITACSSTDYQGNDFKALIYEFMCGGNLESWLHSNEESHDEVLELRNLTLLQRVSIAVDIACALEYLHHDCEVSIVHRDLKPSNVLLDDDMVAHVGDFGLARFLPESSYPNQSSSTGVKGTIGYAAPEYALGTYPSTASDIYSYGIVLLEMMTGKRPTHNMFKEGLNLHTYVNMALPDKVLQVVDPRLLDNDVYVVHSVRVPIQALIGHRMNCMLSVMKIGVACSMESPQDRINIKDANIELQKIRDLLLQGRRI